MKTLNYGFSTDLGGKDENQDEIVIDLEERTGSGMFGVIDGHGSHGKQVANMLKQELSANKRILYSTITKYDSSEELSNELHKVFEAIDVKLKQSIDCYLSGACVSLLIITEVKMVVIHLGDCRVIGFPNSNELNLIQYTQ
jgi:serine/threonine protein phosphatase PrpC